MTTTRRRAISAATASSMAWLMLPTVASTFLPFTNTVGVLLTPAASA